MFTTGYLPSLLHIFLALNHLRKSLYVVMRKPLPSSKPQHIVRQMSGGFESAFPNINNFC